MFPVCTIKTSVTNLYFGMFGGLVVPFYVMFRQYLVDWSWYGSVARVAKSKMAARALSGFDSHGMLFVFVTESSDILHVELWILSSSQCSEHLRNLFFPFTQHAYVSWNQLYCFQFAERIWIILQLCLSLVVNWSILMWLAACSALLQVLLFQPVRT